MFDNFTLIPHTDSEASIMMEPMNEITEKFQALVPSKAYDLRWFGNYILISIANLLAVMSGLTADSENKSLTKYYENDDYNFINDYAKEKGFGIIIHEAPSTRFNPANFPSAKYLENAQEYLKQTPHHFLKIFTIEGNKYLYVWTNKAITPDTFYKLYALQVSMFNKDNTLLSTFIAQLIDNNIINAKQILKDFFLSDEVIDREFEIFKKCLRNQAQSKIEKIEKDIASYRDSINSYENEIASLASKMREMNEKLSFFKYMQEESDDHKIFFKHLKKIPYLKSFKAHENGYIDLEYEAPLIYFSDMPAEKLIAQRNRASSSKDIIRAMLGRKYELITKCALEFNTSNFAISRGTIKSTNPIIRHPHISRYGCFGNHRQAIYDCASTGDYIGAIEQITQAVLNINFYDVCVVDTLCMELWDQRDTLKTWRCKETGEMLTTNEMLTRGDYYEKA